MPCRFFPAGPINVGQRVPCGFSALRLIGSIVPLMLRTSHASLTVGLKGVKATGGAHPLRWLLG